ncbi:MAG: chromate transporter [Alphaproteobacteria bacterium]|nr:chromate transporter [Alphaproteobacteria bacterium]
MIYAILAWEFFKIGLFAVGGGLVTVPFLFNLIDAYHWFTAQELTDMIAISQSTPGPVGINMATYAGFKAAGWVGGIVATLSEVLPSMIVVYFLAQALNKWHENKYVLQVLTAIRPAVLALILAAGWQIARESITDYKTAGLLVFLVAAQHFYRKSAIVYIVFAAIVGVVLKL